VLGYWAMKFLSWLMCVSPRFVRTVFADFTGFIAWLVVPKWRKYMAVQNVMECLGLPEERAAVIVKDSVTRFGRMIVEVLRFPLLNKSNFREIITVNGEEYLEAAFSQHKGVVMCTAHYGNWEMLGASMALLGYPILSVARKQNNSGMDKFINEYRELVGQKVAYNHGENSMLAINRILRDKNLLGIVYDQDTGADGEPVTFFGKPSIVPPGAALLSRLHGAPIIPFFIHNGADGMLTVNIMPPLYTPKTADRKKDVHGIMEQLIVIAEHEIVQDPAMWFWVHDRWKDGKERYRKFMEGEKA